MTDSIRCAICKNFSLRNSPKRDLGLFTCAVGPRWEHKNPYIERECNQFVLVQDKDMKARLEFENSNAIDCNKTCA